MGLPSKLPVESVIQGHYSMEVHGNQDAVCDFLFLFDFVGFGGVFAKHNRNKHKQKTSGRFGYILQNLRKTRKCKQSVKKRIEDRPAIW